MLWRLLLLLQVLPGRVAKGGKLKSHSKVI